MMLSIIDFADARPILSLLQHVARCRHHAAHRIQSLYLDIVTFGNFLEINNCCMLSLIMTKGAYL